MKLSSKEFFRALICLEFLLLVFAVIYHGTHNRTDLLSISELKEMATHARHVMLELMNFVLCAGILTLIVLAASLIGLWRLRSLARPFFVVAIAYSYALAGIPAFDFSAAQIDASMNVIEGVLHVAIIVTMYSRPMREHFR